MSVEIIELIYCDLERRGKGQSKHDPIRRIRQLYSKEGVLFMEDDPQVKHTEGDMVELVQFISDYIKNNGCMPPKDITDKWIASK